MSTGSGVITRDLDLGAKGSLNNWIARYVNLYLNHLIRKHGLGQKSGCNNGSSEAGRRRSKEHSTTCGGSIKITRKEDDNFQPDYLIDRTTPEGLLLAKEMISFAGRSLHGYGVELLDGRDGT